MVKFTKYISALLIFFTAAVFAYGENLEMSASVDKTAVALNETLQLTVSITADSKSLPHYAVPSLNDFNIFSTSQSKSFSIINGAVKNTVYYVYTVGPKKTGTFTIPAFRLKYKGQTYSTNPIDITVEKAKTVSAVSASPAQNSDSSSDGGQIYNYDTSKAVFVEAKTDKKTVYVNEKLVYTFSFWTSVNLLSNPGYTAPDFSDFFNGKTTQRNYRTKIKTRDYVVSEVSTELFPQKEGTLTIGKASVQVSIEDFNKMQDDFFASFFKSARNVNLATDEIKIKVLKVPGSTGLVGSFGMTASVGGVQKKVNEPFDLKVVVKGKGNIKTVKEPEMVLSENLKKYETSEKILKNGEEETGKEFSTLIMPVDAGEGAIKIMPFEYFDPDTKQIKKVKGKNIKVSITGSSVPAVKSGTDTASGEGIPAWQNTGEPQIPQNVDLSFIFKVYAFFQKPLFWIFAGILFMLYVLFRLFVKYREYVNKDRQKLKNKKAYRRSKKYFQKAKKAGNSKEFYSFMYKAMLEYFASVLGESAEGLTTYKIKSDLEERSVNEELIREIEEVLDECSVHLYSGVLSSDKTDFKNFYNKAFEILKKLDI